MSQRHQQSLKSYKKCLLRRLSTMSPPASPILSVQPTRALVDEKVKVLVENLPPGSPVTLHSLHHSEDEDYWEAFGHYVSDFRGIVSGGFSQVKSSVRPRGLNTKMPQVSAVVDIFLLV